MPAFSGASVYWEELFTNNTHACFSSCGDRDSKRGVGIGTDFQTVREENGSLKRGGMSGVAVLGALALGVAVCC